MNPLILWASVAAVVGVAFLYSVYSGMYRRGAAPIEGANDAQQRAADSLRAVLARDSTDVEAMIAYGNLLYDTANWAEAADTYARALARDSSRVQVLVDLGVCWYNQGQPVRAEEIFQLALRHQPGNAVALYNLGILRERAGDDAGALRYFHRSLVAGASGAVGRAVVQHLQAIQQRTGQAAPPPGATALPVRARGRT
jgi:Tfp pilus assembly protein PilF